MMSSTSYALNCVLILNFAMSFPYLSRIGMLSPAAHMLSIATGGVNTLVCVLYIIQIR